MSPRAENALGEAAGHLAGAHRIAVLTGAGISAESGVPTFRGAGGLWSGHRAEDLATPEAFARDPELVWRFYRWRLQRLRDVVPNSGHRALTRLEARCEGFWLITQNVDGLHSRAGSRRVIEIHGSLRTARCSACPFRCQMAGVGEDPVPECPACRGRMRPDVVWFGEALPPDALIAADEGVQRCDVMLVVGTSAVVEPAASFARRAAYRGARLIEVNLEPTPLTAVAHVTLLGKAGEILPRLIDAR